MSGCSAFRGDKAMEQALCVGQERRGNVHIIFKCYPFSNASQDNML